jgi:hypothetical protein
MLKSPDDELKEKITMYSNGVFIGVFNSIDIILEPSIDLAMHIIEFYFDTISKAIKAGVISAKIAFDNIDNLSHEHGEDDYKVYIKKIRDLKRPYVNLLIQLNDNVLNNVINKRAHGAQISFEESNDPYDKSDYYSNESDYYSDDPYN